MPEEPQPDLDAAIETFLQAEEALRRIHRGASALEQAGARLDRAHDVVQDTAGQVEQARDDIAAASGAVRHMAAELVGIASGLHNATVVLQQVDPAGVSRDLARVERAATRAALCAAVAAGVAAVSLFI